MPQLSRINVTPVKGTALQHVDETELTEVGIPGNRRFYLIDEKGRLFSGPLYGRLVQVRAHIDPTSEVLTCRFPDGTVARGPTTLLSSAHDTDFYGRVVHGRAVDGPFAAAFSAYVGREVQLIKTQRDGDGPDVFPLTVVSLASVDDLARRGGYPGTLSSLRFRINLELDGCSPFEEDGWQDRRVQIGDAIVRIRGQIPRCVVTTQDPTTGVRDWNTLKQIASFRQMLADRAGVPFGVYAETELPGLVGVGADVALLRI
jgi:uncharacterized protein YcbX